MTHRYRFDLENGQDAIPDETGVMADGPEMAIEEAQIAIREMRASGELPDSDGRWELVIRDEHGAELKRFPV